MCYYITPKKVFKGDIVGLNKIPSGPEGKLPDVFYTIVEVPKGCSVKYEWDKETGAIFVDRVLYSTLSYPGDYGTIPKTLSGDGDPLDAIVLVSNPNYPGTVIPCRPVGLLRTEDESGEDTKIIAVPTEKIDPRFKEVKDIKDVPKHILEEIKYFYEHYKDLEPKKWVKVMGFEDKDAAKKEIKKSIEDYKG